MGPGDRPDHPPQGRQGPRLPRSCWKGKGTDPQGRGWREEEKEDRPRQEEDSVRQVYHKSSLQKIYYLPLLSVCRNPSLNTSHLWNSWGFRLLLALIHCQKEQKNALLTRG